MVKTLTHPETGRTVRFGRKRPIVTFPRLSLKNYLMKALPPAPVAVDYSPAAMPALSLIYENDSLGDCVIAAQAHIVGVLTGNAGTPPVTFTDDQIISRYSKIGGYIPGDPASDQGCDMQTALASWNNVGMMPMHLPANKHRIAGWLAVDAANVEELKTALWLFENLDFGMELPDAWIGPFPSASGFTWDVAGSADPENGHDVCGVGYSASGVTIDTWALLGTLTWGAIGEYANQQNNGELYVVISQDGINKAQQKAPAGFDWSQLTADFDSIGGHVGLTD